ncbi:hypothetical protein F5877DRAFT_76557 [Lentinula edodes]|nr:hypothetical protein F5877DRAFT_76557 [Lentinula edodes]
MNTCINSLTFHINESRSPHRHNPESELKGPLKHILLTLPPLHQQRIRVHPSQVTLPPITQFMQMTFADRYYNDPNHLPPAFSLQLLGPGRQNSAGDIVTSDSEEGTNIRQPRLLPPKFRPDHRIWNLLRVANYYLPDDLHYAIVTGQHPQLISDLIAKLEADYSLAQHAPAVKVGGRRLSIYSKPHTHCAEESDERNSSAVNNFELSRTNAAASGPSPVPFDDYPRRTSYSQNEENQEHREEFPHLRKYQKYGHGTNVGGGTKSYPSNRKTDETMPTRDFNVHGGGKSFGAGGRIVQPTGKGL